MAQLVTEMGMKAPSTTMANLWRISCLDPRLDWISRSPVGFGSGARHRFAALITATAGDGS